ncbi:hypothetical protein O7635_19170 [Asanoa sp. WMMD1127]|uniref:hypothetical protein n=1 Tax=Asanoa sp. WMMD1127 TaxID=3016107 RepID=UPI0024163C90|nr:hypothetical protein [Asanoa sp. WMMD1127]MDG4823981.1 hypothetical protein [Asanoa sp. WMMD1127]
MRLATAGLAIATILLAGACSSASPSAAPPSVGPSLRDSLVGEPESDPGTQQSRRDTYYADRDKIMGDCLGEAGFDYRPYRPPAQAQEALGLSDDEFARRYGLGISTLIDYPRPAQSADPNQTVRSTLSEAAQRTYDETVLGCEERVITDLGFPPGGGQVVLPPALADVLEKADESMINDPRIVAARDKARRCMAGEGFATSADELSGEISQKAMPLVQKFEAARDALVEQGRDAAGIKVTEVLDKADQRTLGALQRQEIALALAIRRCNGEYLDLQGSVSREYTRKILDGQS